MAAYVPTIFYPKGGGDPRTARNWSEHWHYVYEGWTAGAPAQPPARDEITAKLADLDEALATYAQLTNAAGAPLTGRRGRIVVDTFGDIDDIISEGN